MSQGESYYWMFMFTFKKGSNLYFPGHGLVIEPSKQLTAGLPRTSITFNRKK
jgi:hypothetical protein